MEPPCKRQRVDHIQLHTFDALPTDLLAYACTFLSGQEHKHVAGALNKAFYKAAKSSGSWHNKQAFITWDNAFTEKQKQRGIAVSEIQSKISSLVASWKRWVCTARNQIIC